MPNVRNEKLSEPRLVLLSEIKRFRVSGTWNEKDKRLCQSTCFSRSQLEVWMIPTVSF
jgi:hypothetical protein